MFMLISFVSFISFSLGTIYIINKFMKYENINKGDHMNKIIEEFGQPTFIDSNEQGVLYRYYINPINVFSFSFNKKDSLVFSKYRE